MKHYLVLLLAICYGALSAQAPSKKAIILYNVVPLEVELSNDGTILSVNGRADEYFTGYKLVRVNQYLDPAIANASEFLKPAEDYTVTPKVYNIDFREDLAILNRTSIANLDEVVSQIIYNSEQNVMLTPYAANSAEEKILLENRLKAVLMYLEVKGISKGKIALNEIPQTVRKGQLIATIIK